MAAESLSRTRQYTIKVGFCQLKSLCFAREEGLFLFLFGEERFGIFGFLSLLSVEHIDSARKSVYNKRTNKIWEVFQR